MWKEPEFKPIFLTICPAGSTPPYPPPPDPCLEGCQLACQYGERFQEPL